MKVSTLGEVRDYHMRCVGLLALYMGNGRVSSNILRYRRLSLFNELLGYPFQLEEFLNESYLVFKSVGSDGLRECVIHFNQQFDVLLNNLEDYVEEQLEARASDNSLLYYQANDFGPFTVKEKTNHVSSPFQK